MPEPNERPVVSDGILSRVRHVLHRKFRAERTGETPPRMLTVPEAIEAIRPYVRTTPEVRRQFQEAGIHVEPAWFYSAIPTVEEVGASFEYAGDGLPYCDPSLFDDRRHVDFLRELTAFAHEFDPPLEGDPATADRFYWNNGMFSHADAMAYYCMVRMLKPRRIVEIGCGFSTLVALEALERNGRGSITCVEPYPPPYLRNVADRLERLIPEPVQKVPPSFFSEQLSDGDLLFIDSTHTVKIGSDCVYLYLTVLPYLAARVMVHAHDIYIPRAFTPDWALAHQLYWTEPYLLHALLLDNPKFEVMYGAQYQMARHPESLDALMGGKFGPSIGCSLWFRRT